MERGSGGVFFWAVPITCGTDVAGQPIPGIKAVYFVAVMGDEDETIINDERLLRSERPATGYYPFGLDQGARRILVDLYGFTRTCEVIPNSCVVMPGRRVIIWYDAANDEPNGIANRPEIKTVYYHVAVDEHPYYSQWRGLCSKDRNMTWTKAMIENNPAYNVCKITTALDSGGFRIGQVRRIGFATAAHLHYEVHIDRHNDGNLDDLDNRDREDPLMAFQTIR